LADLLLGANLTKNSSHKAVLGMEFNIRVVVSVSTLETYQIINILSPEKLSTSRSRPFTSRAQDQFSAKLCRPQYAVWMGFRRCKPML